MQKNKKSDLVGPGLKACQKTLDAAKAKTKDQRERVLSDGYVKEALEKCDAIEKALEQVNEAELPFLKGIEVIPLAEATKSIQDSEAAASIAQKGVNEARSFVTGFPNRWPDRTTETTELRNFTQRFVKK